MIFNVNLTCKACRLYKKTCATLRINLAIFGAYILPVPGGMCSLSGDACVLLRSWECFFFLSTLASGIYQRPWLLKGKGAAARLECSEKSSSCRCYPVMLYYVWEEKAVPPSSPPGHSPNPTSLFSKQGTFFLFVSVFVFLEE